MFRPKKHKFNVFSRATDVVLMNGRFDGELLATNIKDTIKTKSSEDECAKFRKDSPKCRLLVSTAYESPRTRSPDFSSFVCAMRRDITQPVRLRSYCTNQVDEVDCEIWEAACATSAASSFFDPIRIGKFEEEYIDGATGWNNPVDEVLSETRLIWPDADRRIQCLVSVGTGIPSLKAFGENMKDVAQSIVNVATETEVTAQRFLKSHAFISLKGRYFRFNVLKGLEDVGLQEYEEKATIAASTKAYLLTHTVASEVLA